MANKILLRIVLIMSLAVPLLAQAEDESNIAIHLADPIAVPSAEAVIPANLPAEMAPVEVTTLKVKESEIPVLNSVKAKKSAAGSSYARMIMSLLVICTMAFGLLYFSKWYAKAKPKAADVNKIKVLTQHYFGPKKSLAIVRVAGETILIGITDQNISMIKSLSLIDEELPETLPTNFDKSLDQANLNAEAAPARTADKTSADEADEFVMNSIQDKVSIKLKGMRSI